MLFYFITRDCYSRRRFTAAFSRVILRVIYSRVSKLLDCLDLMFDSSTIPIFFLLVGEDSAYVKSSAFSYGITI
jgi:hypothetical protein